MRLPNFKVIGSLFLAATPSAPAWGTSTSEETAMPGTLNYVEAQVSMGTQALDPKSIGSAELHVGGRLTTEKGKAEILLTPGVFLRVGGNTSVKMISPSLTDTEVGLSKGQAMVEVAEIHSENEIRITEGGSTTELLKTGLYDFDVSPTWRKPTSMRLAFTRRTAGARGGLAGGVPTGIGIPGLTLIRSSQGMGFSSARSAGGSIRPGSRIAPLSMEAIMEAIDTDTAATTITSVRTTVIGTPVPTMSEVVLMREASTADPDPQAAVATLDPAGSVEAGSVEAGLPRW